MLLIFGCALRDRVLDDLRRAGVDSSTLRLVGLSLPHDLPAPARQAERDRIIGDIVRLLRGRHPGASERALARLIHRAGQHIEAGDRDLSAAGFDTLSQGDRAMMSSRISSMLEWLPARHDGRKWVSFQTLRRLILAS
jgi:hypothetical protein